MGVIDAAVHGIETVHTCLAHVIEAVHASGGTCLITADHGNAEHMLEEDGSPNTADSTNPVPLIVTVPGLALRDGGVLGDVAPTLLELLGIGQPDSDDRTVDDRARRGAERRLTRPRRRSAPANRARPPSSSSIRRSWLYLATRSVRAGAPVLICPTPVATTRSAMNVSSVSPER